MLSITRKCPWRSRIAGDFFFPSEPGTDYAIEATTDFDRWVGLTNLIAPPGDFMDLVDPDAPLHPHRFYRWRR
jgi:hypothetical protein